jgi:glycine dehydrogenase subunit 2
VVKEALMIEPTETEGKETLDAFAEAMIAIVKEAKAAPELFEDAPHDTVVSRLDEVAAARNPILCFKP